MAQEVEDRCEYKGFAGSCREPTYSNSLRCILHADLPSDPADAKKLKELKVKKFGEKKGQKDFNFEGATLIEVFFRDEYIEDAIFINTVFIGSTRFERVTFFRAHFDGAIFRGDEDEQHQNVSFEGAIFVGEAPFSHAEFKLPVMFQAEFHDYANFIRATFRKEAWFTGATFGNGANFLRGTFEETSCHSGPPTSEVPCRSKKLNF
jgi:hypothetical protein